MGRPRRARQLVAVPVAALRGHPRRRCERHVPGAELANSHSVGFTDSNWFRAAYPDMVAYNFAPHLVEGYDEVTPRYHNVDERILVRDLAFQALFAERVALRGARVSAAVRCWR